MIRAAVLGSPISHSLSPKIHNKAFEILSVAGAYEAIEVNEASFSAFISENLNDTWSGFSLTMPLKEIVLKVAGKIDDRAKRINSANTLYRLASGWGVTSTDCLAFENLTVVDSDTKIAVIGGGGTARAAIGALNSSASAVDVLLRNPDRLSGMSGAAPDILVNLREMSTPLDSYDLIIQTTPAGAFDLHAGNLKNVHGTLIECLYKPWPTPLSSRFEELGGTVISGKQLLVEQALFQIELFTQVNFDFSEMRKLLLSHIASD
jgi:shikimate dehydrogenase